MAYLIAAIVMTLCAYASRSFIDCNLYYNDRTVWLSVRLSACDWSVRSAGQARLVRSGGQRAGQATGLARPAHSAGLHSSQKLDTLVFGLSF